MMDQTLDILGARILIVDDQDANVQLLEGVLGEAGYTCVSSTMNPRSRPSPYSEPGLMHRVSPM